MFDWIVFGHKQYNTHTIQNNRQGAGGHLHEPDGDVHHVDGKLFIMLVVKENNVLRWVPLKQIDTITIQQLCSSY